MAVLSVILMSLDQRSSLLLGVRSFLNLAIYPLQTIASVPLDSNAWLQEQFKSQQSLLEKNEKYRTENLFLKAQLQKFTSLQAENIRLRPL